MTMMKSIKHYQSRNHLLLALAAVLMINLSCKLPLISGGNSEEGLAEDIQSSGILFVDEVSLSESLVSIEYAVLPEDSLELMVAGWLNTFMAAYESEPDAEAYQLVISMNDEPYLEVLAQGLDLEGLVEDELSGEEFLDRLEVSDVRPVDVRALDLLTPLGLDLDGVRLDGGELVVAYWPAPAEGQGALMEEWWAIFEALAGLGDEVSAIKIQNMSFDGSMISVIGESSGLEAYLTGEITAVDFLAGLEVEMDLVELEESGE
jgi:hypothetical protein